LLITVCLFSPFFSFGHCAVLLITVCLFCPFFRKKRKNRQTVISNKAQWAKEKKGLNRQTVISNTAQWAKGKKDKIDKQ
jgi:hypothetical protein